MRKTGRDENYQSELESSFITNVRNEQTGELQVTGMFNPIRYYTREQLEQLYNMVLAEIVNCTDKYNRIRSKQNVLFELNTDKYTGDLDVYRHFIYRIFGYIRKNKTTLTDVFESRDILDTLLAISMNEFFNKKKIDGLYNILFNEEDDSVINIDNTTEIREEISVKSNVQDMLSGIQRRLDYLMTRDIPMKDMELLRIIRRNIESSSDLSALLES